MKIKVSRSLLAFILPAVAASSANAAAIFTGGVYTQNFDSMGPAGTTAPTDWIVSLLTGNPSRVTDGGGAASGGNITLTVDNGSDATAGRSFNYGTTAASDRAIGNKPTTTASGDRIMQLTLNNNTGAPITTLGIGYTGEQWNLGQGTSSSGSEMLRLYYSLSPSSGWVSVGLDWTAPIQALLGNPQGARDGNASGNRTVLSTNFTPASPIAPGTDFYLRWLDWYENSTNDHGLAIDDVSITATPEPASIGLLALGGLTLVNRRRRRA
jgi:hypothetical protein